MSRSSISLKELILAEMMIPHGAEYYLIHSLVFNSKPVNADKKTRGGSQKKNDAEQYQTARNFTVERVAQRNSIKGKYIGSNTISSEIQRMISKNSINGTPMTDKERIRNASASDMKALLQEIAIKKLKEKSSN